MMNYQERLKNTCWQKNKKITIKQYAKTTLESHCVHNEQLRHVNKANKTNTLTQLVCEAHSQNCHFQYVALQTEVLVDLLKCDAPLISVLCNLSGQVLRLRKCISKTQFSLVIGI